MGSDKRGDSVHWDDDSLLSTASTRQKRQESKRKRIICGAILGLFGLYAWSFTRGEFDFALFGPPKAEKLTRKGAEKLFLSIPDEASAIEASKLYAGKPHRAGSDRDLETAKEFLYHLQREFDITATSGEEDPVYPAGSASSQDATLGIPDATEPRAWIDVYYPVMNTPLDRALQGLADDGSVQWEADLDENAGGQSEDEDAAKYSESVPTFHGLSADGDVTGKLVYVNYGTKDDYDSLVSSGVDLTGAIVLARYGANFRGLKIGYAEDLGAAGVLIYSDPRDDGLVQPENGYLPYPSGPGRNADSVQRGSVQFLSKYPGDPTTPGRPAYENATREEHGGNIPKIPSLPISWANAKVLKEDWLGKQVRLANHVDTRVMPIWNTYGLIPGEIASEVVVLGNHRDAWVLGAADPSSGTSSIHETIRGLGALVRSGWKPRRSILIASWDAEEYGLIGSTEWGEDFEKFIDEHVVAYLNLDGSASGAKFSVQASPLLSHISYQTALDIPHPTDEGRSLWDATNDEGPFTGNGSYVPDEYLVGLQQELNAEAGELKKVGPLGSGSDYTVFLQRIGVASMNHGFGSTPTDAVYHYHSVYDSQRWMELYGDPGFYRHVAVAKHLGLLALRIADSAVLPLNTTHYAYELEGYLEKVASILDEDDNLDVDLHPLKKSIKDLQDASLALDGERAHLEAVLHRLQTHGHRRPSRWRKLLSLIGLKPHSSSHCGKAHITRKISKINTILSRFESTFIHADGLPGRDWYRHLGVAPGRWLGYGATTLPALTEAVGIDRDAESAQEEVQRLVGVVEALVELIKG